MTKRVLFALTLILALLPIAAHAAKLPSFAELQAHAAAAAPAMKPMDLVDGDLAKVAIPTNPPYANVYARADQKESVSLLLQVGNVSFVPASAPSVQLNAKDFGYLPRRNGLQANGVRQPSDWALTTVVKTNLPFGTTTLGLKIPFTDDTYYEYGDKVTRPFADYFDACQNSDASGNPVDGVDVFLRLRGYAAGSPAPQTSYHISIGTFASDARAAYGNTLPSPVWLYAHVSVGDYYAHFANPAGGTQALNVWIQAIGQWVSFYAYWPSNLAICQKG